MSEISAAATSTVVRAARVFTLSSPLSYAILDRPRPGQAAVLHDEAGIPTLVHFADTEADAQTWLKAHPRRAARVVAVDVPEPRAFTYLQDPGHGWLIVNRAELDSVGMSSADFSRCSYVLGDSFALEKDRDNAGVLENVSTSAALPTAFTSATPTAMPTSVTGLAT